jgi:hypothetical protein
MSLSDAGARTRSWGDGEGHGGRQEYAATTVDGGWGLGLICATFEAESVKMERFSYGDR